MVAREEVIEVLQSIEDPELFLDIWFLGLIYHIDISEEAIRIEMTFTTPLCPAGPSIIEEIKRKLSMLQGIRSVEVDVVFQPPWTPSDDVKAMLGMM